MAYIGQEPGLGQAERFIFTASGAEEVVSTADDGRVIGYTAGQVSVYLNGVKLVVGTDCIATNGSTITGLSALSASDVVEVIALSAFSPSDTVSAASGGTFSGAVTLPSPVINTGVSGTAILDEDAMGSDSATKLATQQSIKAYVDSAGTNSSITTLGTVTAGNISHADIVYPAGHVLQVVSTLTTTQAVQTITTSDTQVGLLTKTIIPKGANSDFLVVARWMGEVNEAFNVVFNIQQDGTRVNINGGGRGYGLASPLLTYNEVDNNTTPENVNFSTLVSTSSVIGTGINFKVVADSSNSRTLWNNRCYGGSEYGTSEIIITEIKG